jgi:cobalt-zinc-cadmium efflux system membrane fusion protein
MVPNPWKATAAPVQPKTEAMAGVEVVPGIPHTLRVPEEVRRSLGIRAGNKETDYLANLPTKMPPLVLPGSTALDPTHLMRIRARFAPAEVVEIGKVAEDNSPDSQPPLRELRPGDQVKKGQLLAVLYSVDVASKKNDLVDALVQLKLDQEILERAEKVNGSLPDVFILSARRNVESDRNAIARAISSLKVWNIPEKDIQAVHKEADEILKRKGQRDKTVEAVWPRVEILAPDSGTIVERNVALHEMVVDNTVNLFQIAQVERLTVIANIPEDDLPILQGLDAMHRRWTVKPAGAPEKNGKLEISGLIEEIGYIIDPNQHTAIIKGTIANPGGKLRAGQFVTVTITIPPPTDVVEVPVGALIEDGQQSFVFVQPDKDKPEYSLCRVVVKQRFDKTAYVQTDHCYVRTEIADGKPLTDEEKELGMLPREPLWKGSRILVAGGLELKHALMDLESQNAKSGPE